MANLTPTAGWDSVPQLETSTPALGGPGGPMNGQAQALLNRTEQLLGLVGGVTVANQSAKTVLAGPTGGSAAAPTFRALAATDLPVVPTVIVPITWASTISVDLSGQPNGAIYRCTLAGNTTVNITGGTDGQKAVIELKQDATGSRVVTLGTGFAFGTDITAYVATTAANKTDVLGVIYNSTAAKYRVVATAKGY